jgi:hypothetical protein
VHLRWPADLPVECPPGCLNAEHMEGHWEAIHQLACPDPPARSTARTGRGAGQRPDPYRSCTIARMVERLLRLVLGLLAVGLSVIYFTQAAL